MFRKKIIACSVLLAMAGFSQQAAAGYFYLGPGIYYEDITSSNSTVRGIHPKISAGYGTCYKSLRLGAELFAIPGIVTLDDSHDDGSPSIKPTQEYGASFLPGFQLNDSSFIYGRLGAVTTRFNGPDTRKTGGQLGVGLEGKISRNWDARLEYIYTIYSSINGMGTPYSNEVGFGVIRKFYW